MWQFWHTSLQTSKNWSSCSSNIYWRTAATKHLRSLFHCVTHALETQALVYNHLPYILTSNDLCDSNKKKIINNICIYFTYVPWSSKNTGEFKLPPWIMIYIRWNVQSVYTFRCMCKQVVIKGFAWKYSLYEQLQYQGALWFQILQ